MALVFFFFGKTIDFTFSFFSSLLVPVCLFVFELLDDSFKRATKQISLFNFPDIIGFWCTVAVISHYKLDCRSGSGITENECNALILFYNSVSGRS